MPQARTTLVEGAAMYAIEMRKGWFAERGIRAATAFPLPPPTR
jgi:hypothetical protein